LEWTQKNRSAGDALAKLRHGEVFLRYDGAPVSRLQIAARCGRRKYAVLP